MENQNLNEMTTEARIDISANLLETPHREPDLNRTEKDFIQQNEIINQEVKKYDRRLGTCSMIIFRAWLSIYLLSIILGIDQLTYFLLKVFKDMSALAWTIRIFYICKVLVLLGLFYGCILLWRAADAKDLFKIERCIFIFKTCFIISIAFNLVDITFGFVQYPSWDQMVLGISYRLGYAGINYAVALYVKRVLVERDVYQQVSSYPNGC